MVPNGSTYLMIFLSTQQFLTFKPRIIPVVPPKNRKSYWQYDVKLYKHRNEVERFSFVLNNSEKFLLATLNLRESSLDF